MLVDMENRSGNDGVGGRWSWGFGSLVRRKQVDSAHVRREGHQLARKLSAIDLVAIGVGSTIGAGVYILVGTVAREYTGPALTISFLVAGIAAALSAFCYAELACRCPSAGSAYHYTYICIGEGIAWLVGWSLILEYTIGGSAVARGITPNLALFFGGQDKLPSLLARHTLPGLGIVVDPCAAVLILIVTVLLCFGIKESSMAQAIVTTVNVCAMLFIITAGGYLGFKTGWAGYELPSGYFPFGLKGMFTGSAIVFFSYIGFDSVTSTAEEVKHPQRDLPLGIALALLLCCIFYMFVSMVIVGLVPYYALDPDTPISSAFSSYGVQWAVYIITIGAVTALFASLLGSILPQPRILMAMARDGLLPSFFSDINKHTHVPLKSTIATGAFAAILAFFMDVSQLAGMVSVGTLLAFTTACKSIVSSLRGGGDSKEVCSINPKECDVYCETSSQYKHDKVETLLGHPFIIKEVTQDEQTEQTRRKIAAWTISVLCIGILILACAASVEFIPSAVRYTSCGGGGLLLLCSLIVLACMDQDDRRHTFGHTGGFACPFVPFLPAACILINTYLLFDLGAATWMRVSVWLLIGALVYVVYGRSHSSLLNAVYVPSAGANEIYGSSSDHVA
ncbi:Cationic amino acid transporter vacuolar-like [Quillaja saponaria]|uniref:Cationic amino acid transporter vacuolar-like n=1 Tax=Quillaja saponaria TaxID=32244 RepID=A0AAD7VI38_QUISA|nr:Cationic amino acid transporter vacuolar-like [Quillaja saponaria]KAJ7976435.1 Cationic amino acid transporter vacuolar-like [Quillaja saponaria]